MRIASGEIVRIGTSGGVPKCITSRSPGTELKFSSAESKSIWILPAAGCDTMSATSPCRGSAVTSGSSVAIAGS